MRKQRITLPSNRAKNLARARKLTQEYANGLTYKEIAEKHEFPYYMVALWVNDFVTSHALKTVEETHIYNRLTSLHNKALNKVVKKKELHPEDYTLISQYNRVATKLGKARLNKTPMAVRVG